MNFIVAVLALIGGIVVLASAFGAFIGLVVEFAQLFLCVTRSIKKRFAHTDRPQIEGGQS